MRAARLEIVLALVAAACALYGFGLPDFGFAYAPGARPENGLRVVTWNVGEAAGFGQRAARDETLARVGETVATLDPDLLVLQEVSESALERIADALPGARTYHAGGGRGCGVVAQRGNLVPLPPRRWTGRPAVHVVYRGERDVLAHLIGLHASSWSAAERNEEIGRAVDSLAELDEALPIVAGDLNLDVDLESGRDLFTDDEYLDVQTYNYLAEHLTDAALGTGPTAEPDRRLDYVFVGTERWRVADAGVWRGHRVGSMDHHPVVVDLARR